MLEKIISGGQTGADQGGWWAARAAGVATGGWMVGNFWTEEGDRPEFATEYGASVLPGVNHLRFGVQLRRRAEANVQMADGTVCFDEIGSNATANAESDCRWLDRPFRCVSLKRNPFGRLGVTNGSHSPNDIAAWIIESGIRTLNVAGNRESKAFGIGAFVESYLSEVLRLLDAVGHLQRSES